MNRERTSIFSARRGVYFKQREGVPWHLYAKSILADAEMRVRVTRVLVEATYLCFRSFSYLFRRKKRKRDHRGRRRRRHYSSLLRLTRLSDLATHRHRPFSAAAPRPPRPQWRRSNPFAAADRQLANLQGTNRGPISSKHGIKLWEYHYRQGHPSGLRPHFGDSDLIVNFLTDPAWTGASTRTSRRLGWPPCSLSITFYL